MDKVSEKYRLKDSSKMLHSISLRIYIRGPDLIRPYLFLVVLAIGEESRTMRDGSDQRQQRSTVCRTPPRLTGFLRLYHLFMGS